MRDKMPVCLVAALCAIVFLGIGLVIGAAVFLANANTSNNPTQQAEVFMVSATTAAPLSTSLGVSCDGSTAMISASNASLACHYFNAEIATPTDIVQAQTAGAQWCICSEASNLLTYFPSQNCGVLPCSTTIVAPNDCVSVACYGIKPPTSQAIVHTATGLYSLQDQRYIYSCDGHVATSLFVTPYYCSFTNHAGQWSHWNTSSGASSTSPSATSPQLLTIILVSGVVFVSLLVALFAGAHVCDAKRYVVHSYESAT